MQSKEDEVTVGQTEKKLTEGKEIETMVDTPARLFLWSENPQMLIRENMSYQLSVPLAEARGLKY